MLRCRIHLLTFLLLLLLKLRHALVPHPLLSEFLEHQRLAAQSLTTHHVPFREGCSIIWGEKTNVRELKDKMTVQLVLDKSSGSGFKSKNRFRHGFFSAWIKLPANYTAGVITAFYASNSDVYPNNHDELDFEFLGVVPGMQHVLQTNIYSNGSVHTGREERIGLWFDPTMDFHHYSILWNKQRTIFLVDGIPIREMRRKDVQSDEHYPSKPMSVYATIWDGSKWATSGGKFPVDYSKAPFLATFTNISMRSTVSGNPKYEAGDAVLLQEEDLSWKHKLAMGWVRKKLMTYSYCHDEKRYSKALPDCAQAKEIANFYDQTFH